MATRADDDVNIEIVFTDCSAQSCTGATDVAVAFVRSLEFDGVWFR